MSPGHRGTFTGSPAYTAREVLQGHPSEVPSNVHSLASTLFSAGTGHTVYERRKGEQVVIEKFSTARSVWIPQ